MVAEGRDFSLGPAERWRYKEPSSFAFRPKDDLISVGGPVGLPVVAGSCGDPDGSRGAHPLYPDVELATPVRAVGHKSPIRRPAGTELQVCVKGKARENARWRRTGFPLQQEENSAHAHQ